MRSPFAGRDLTLRHLHVAKEFEFIQHRLVPRDVHEDSRALAVLRENHRLAGRSHLIDELGRVRAELRHRLDVTARLQSWHTGSQEALYGITYRISALAATPVMASNDDVLLRGPQRANEQTLHHAGRGRNPMMLPRAPAAATPCYVASSVLQCKT